MNLNELISEIQDIALSHNQITNVQIGNNFEVAQSKSSEKYPCMWVELPVLIDYIDDRRKTLTFALNFLTKAKHDDITDLVNKISDMEVCGDEVLKAIDYKFTNIGIADISALTIRNFSGDDLCGVRVELTFYIGRVCDYKSSFTKPVE